MARVRFRTDFRLWLLAAGGLFASLGFVDPVAGVAKGDNSLWSYVARFVTGDYFCSTPDIVIPILFRRAGRSTTQPGRLCYPISTGSFGSGSF